MLADPLVISLPVSGSSVWLRNATCVTSWTKWPLPSFVVKVMLAGLAVSTVSVPTVLPSG